MPAKKKERKDRKILVSTPLNHVNIRMAASKKAPDVIPNSVAPDFYILAVAIEIKSRRNQTFGNHELEISSLLFLFFS